MTYQTVSQSRAGRGASRRSARRRPPRASASPPRRRAGPPPRAAADLQPGLQRLFRFWILGCARDLWASSSPLYRPVAGLRTSKSGTNPSQSSSRSPSDPKP